MLIVKELITDTHYDQNVEWVDDVMVKTGTWRFVDGISMIRSTLVFQITGTETRRLFLLPSLSAEDIRSADFDLPAEFFQHGVSPPPACEVKTMSTPILAWFRAATLAVALPVAGTASPENPNLAEVVDIYAATDFRNEMIDDPVGIAAKARTGAARAALEAMNAAHGGVGQRAGRLALPVR